MGRTVKYAALAQLVEQLICNQQVNGSSPLGGSIKPEAWGEVPLAGTPGCYPGRCWFESNRPSHLTKR